MNRAEAAGIVSSADPPRMTGSRRDIPVVDFTIALSDARWNPDTGTHDVVSTFVRCHAYGEQLAAVEAAGGIRKGDTVHVVGKLSQRQREMPGGRMERKTHIDAVVLTVVGRKPRTPAPPDDPWQARP